MNDDNFVMKSKNGRPLLRLLAYGKPYIGWFLLALLIILVVVWVELYQPRILGSAVDEFIEAKDVSGVLKQGLLYGASVVVQFVLTYLQAMILAQTSQKIIFNLRNDIFTHLTKLHIGFFNDNPVGRLVTRVTNDCETVSQLFTDVIVNILKGIFVLLGVMGSMLLYNGRLSLYIFTVIPVITVLTFLFTTATRKIYRQMRAMISELNAFVGERITGMQVVQAFTAEKDMEKDFRDKTEKLRQVNMKQLFAFALYSPVSYIMNITALAHYLLSTFFTVCMGVMGLHRLVRERRRAGYL